MEGWSIFKHSLLLVLRNWQEALRIGLVPAAVIVALVVLTVGPEVFAAAMSGDPEAVPPEAALGFLVTLLAGIVATLVIVVNWHRFVLLEEYPNGWIPPFHGSFVLGYFGRLLLLSLVGIAAMIPLLIVMALFGPLGAILMPFAMLGISIAFYRLAVILPAGAIGRSLSFREAWEATKGSTGPIFIMLLLLFLANLVIQIVVVAVSAVLPIIGLVLSVPASLVMALAGVSILTTLYGHYVEGRAID